MRHAATIACALLIATTGMAQNAAETPAAAAQRGVDLTRAGHCQDALPLLREAPGRVTDKDLERRAGMAGVRCAMTLNQPEDVARFLDWMSHDFPHDPEFLYLAVHAYSDLSLRASQELMYAAPASAQVHQLHAEALETQGQWEKAMEEYRIVLKRSPDMPGIHFRIGRLILSEPESATTFEQARTEMEAELKIDPDNAGAEYVLGEIARRNGDFTAAVEHFSRASKLDAMFPDALIGLGRSLMATKRYAEALPQLERAEKLDPANPATHLFLSTTYLRLGRKEDAQREAAARQHASDAATKAKDSLATGILGGQQADTKDAQAQP